MHAAKARVPGGRLLDLSDRAGPSRGAPQQGCMLAPVLRRFAVHTAWPTPDGTASARRKPLQQDLQSVGHP